MPLKFVTIMHFATTVHILKHLLISVPPPVGFGVYDIIFFLLNIYVRLLRNDTMQTKFFIDV